MAQEHTYDVTIIVREAGFQQAVTVSAPDEWKARTRAIARCAYPLRGERVDYVVEERR